MLFLENSTVLVQKARRVLAVLLLTTNTHAHFVKFARFCVTLAMSVSVRAVRSSGYSCIKLKSEGDMMAGQRNRRNKDALMSRSLMSGRPRLLHSCRHDAKTSFSSLGKTLRRRRDGRDF